MDPQLRGGGRGPPRAGGGLGRAWQPGGARRPPPPHPHPPAFRGNRHLLPSSCQERLAGSSRHSHSAHRCPCAHSSDMNSVSSKSEGDEQTATQTVTDGHRQHNCLEDTELHGYLFFFPGGGELNEREMRKAPTNLGGLSELRRVALAPSLLRWFSSPPQTFLAPSGPHNSVSELQITAASVSATKANRLWEVRVPAQDSECLNSCKF